MRGKTGIGIMAGFDQTSLIVYAEYFCGNYNLTVYCDVVYQGVLVFVITFVSLGILRTGVFSTTLSF